MSLEKKLNHIEKQEFKDCEFIIDDGLKGFISVGNALAKIRDEKLYREITTHLNHILKADGK